MRKFYGHRTKSTNSVANVFGTVSMGVLSLRVERENSVFIEVWRVQSFQNGKPNRFLDTKPSDYHTRIS